MPGWKKPLKRMSLLLTVLIRDILNQNTGINRNFNRNTFTETSNDRLKRYWMIGFIWNFKNSGAKAK